MADGIERIGAEADGGPDLVVGDGMAETDVHRVPRWPSVASNRTIAALCGDSAVIDLRSLKVMRRLLD